jgi:hypothetical protein
MTGQDGGKEENNLSLRKTKRTHRTVITYIYRQERMKFFRSNYK